MTTGATPSVASDTTDAASTRSRRSWFKRKPKADERAPSVYSEKAATIESSSSTSSRRRSDDDDIVGPLETLKDDKWRIGDDVRMQLDLG